VEGEGGRGGFSDNHIAGRKFLGKVSCYEAKALKGSVCWLKVISNSLER
jgi:hypothetical protein